MEFTINDIPANRIELDQESRDQLIKAITQTGTVEDSYYADEWSAVWDEDQLLLTPDSCGENPLTYRYSIEQSFNLLCELLQPHTHWIIDCEADGLVVSSYDEQWS